MTEVETFVLGLVMAATMDDAQMQAHEGLFPFAKWVDFWGSAQRAFQGAATRYQWVSVSPAYWTFTVPTAWKD